MKEVQRTLWYFLRHFPDKYPRYLAEGFPHVIKRMEQLWDDPPAMSDYFQDLLIPSRPNRRGFPPEVAAEIFILSAAYAAIRRKNAERPDDPWEHERATRALEEMGIRRTGHNFARAIEEGRSEVCLLFISAGFDVNMRDAREWTPLMIASFNGKEDIALMLIEQGADPRAQDRGGYGPMHWAAYNGYAKVIKLLVSEGAAADAMSKAGISPLLQAAARGHKEACMELIAAGANVNAQANDGTSPLIKAVANGHEAIVALLLDAGAQVDAVMTDGTSLITIALCGRNLAIRDMILARATPRAA